MKRRGIPVATELLNQAAQLIEDGASQREVCRTTGLARETIRKYFPGKGWTFIEGGEFRQLTRDRTHDFSTRNQPKKRQAA